MEKQETALRGVYILKPQVFYDERGFFMESYSRKTAVSLGIEDEFVQDNHSFTLKRGTIRGLHYQEEPFAQSKLVRCTAGEIMDVVVDIRRDSETYLKWVSVTLSTRNNLMIYIPAGYAHGFLTLSSNAEVQYKTGAYYNKDAERTIRYDDPKIGVEWGVADPIMSDKDKAGSYL